MKFKRAIFGFIDMIRYSKLTKKRAEHLANGSDAPLEKTYKTNDLAKELHPLYMNVELVEINKKVRRSTNLFFAVLITTNFHFLKPDNM